MTSWLALSEASPEMGAPRFVATSHLRGVVRHTPVPNRAPGSSGWRLVPPPTISANTGGSDRGSMDQAAICRMGAWTIEEAPITVRMHAVAMRRTPPRYLQMYMCSHLLQIDTT